MKRPEILTTDDAIINPQKSKFSPDIGSVAAMAATRADLFLLCDLLQFNKNEYERLFISRLYFNRSRLGSFSVTGPFVGAPYAVMLLETLIAWGARRIIFLGWCGAVSDTVKIGDLILPTSVVIDEGTSKHYGIDDIDHLPVSFRMVRKIGQALKKKDIEYHEGTVWTTDAVYREGRQQVQAHRQKGVLAVDMEISALYSAAKFRGVDLGGILVVSDELSSMKWRPGFKHKKFMDGRQTACRVTKELICEECATSRSKKQTASQI
ncbi:MAG: nucleoside phosphorylase [Desulfobacterales bacterium]|nr:MAG: nucleoside phosphorylase [Desulfobacterales bacterium]